MKPPGTNGKAIAALVCSVSGFVCCLSAIPGVILGIAAMRETKRTGQDGYALALAGTILGGLMVVGHVALRTGDHRPLRQRMAVGLTAI